MSPGAHGSGLVHKASIFEELLDVGMGRCLEDIRVLGWTRWNNIGKVEAWNIFLSCRRLPFLLLGYPWPLGWRHVVWWRPLSLFYHFQSFLYLLIDLDLSQARGPGTVFPLRLQNRFDNLREDIRKVGITFHPCLTWMLALSLARAAFSEA